MSYKIKPLMLEFPCHECASREDNCHSHCELYAEAKNKQTEYSEKLREERAKDQYFLSQFLRKKERKDY